MNTLKSDLFESYDALGNKEIHAVTVFDFLEDTKRFLDENYRGCYKTKRASSYSGTIMIRTDGYAEFLKFIFKSVLADHIITLTPKIDSKLLKFDIRFDTALLDEEAIEKLLLIAEESGFCSKMTNKGIVLHFALLDASYSGFQAVSSSFIYNILRKTFAS